MDQAQARDSIRAIEQIWETTIFDKEEWEAALLELDHLMVAGTLLELLMSNPELPSIPVVVAAAREAQDALAAIVDPTAGLQMQPETPEPPVRPFVRDLDPWVKGWAVSRYRHRDNRVFPEQKIGYDSIQLANPGYRTYVWPEQEVMDPEDAARYIKEGEPLKVSEIFSMICPV